MLHHDTFAVPLSDRREFLQAVALGLGVIAVSGRSEAAQAPAEWTVGVIGASGAGDYGHGLHTMWLSLPETRIVGLADADEAGRLKTQKQLGDPPAFADYREMLARTQPRIVAVCPRHLGEHHSLILAAIEAGARGIYCEKPFCRTPEEADEIVAACRRKNVKLALAHRNHYHPALQTVLRMIDAGELGEILEFRGRGLEDHRGGVLDLWVLGSHVFDLALTFGGAAEACSASVFKGSRPIGPRDIESGAEAVGPVAGDRLHARFDMNCGVPFYFDSIRGLGVPKIFGLQIVGTRGVVDLKIDKHPIAHFIPGNPTLPSAELRPWIPVSSAGAGIPEPDRNLEATVSKHQLAARDLFAAIVEDRAPACDERRGAAIVEMIHGVFASHRQAGQRVTLPLAERRHPWAGWSE